MEELFLPYNLALKVKEKKFSEKCFAKFNNGKFQINSLGGGNNYNDGSFGKKLISAPLYDQVINWLKEKYNIHIVSANGNVNNEAEYNYDIYTTDQGKWACLKKQVCFSKNQRVSKNKTIEEALKFIENE